MIRTRYTETMFGIRLFYFLFRSLFLQPIYFINESTDLFWENNIYSLIYSVKFESRCLFFSGKNKDMVKEMK